MPRGTPAPCDGAQKLAQFIERSGVSCKKAADAVDTVHPALLAWLRGTTKPDAYRRALIEVWTARAVPASAWLSENERTYLRKIRPFKRVAA